MKKTFMILLTLCAWAVSFAQFGNGGTESLQNRIGDLESGIGTYGLVTADSGGHGGDHFMASATGLDSLLAHWNYFKHWNDSTAMFSSRSVSNLDSVLLIWGRYKQNADSCALAWGRYKQNADSSALIWARYKQNLDSCALIWGRYKQNLDSVNAIGPRATAALDTALAHTARVYASIQKADSNTTYITPFGDQILYIPTTDSTGSGTKQYVQFGEIVAVNQTVYKKSDGKWWLADANAGTTMPVGGISMSTKAANAYGYILREGIWNFVANNFAVGDTSAIIYQSETPGAFVQTPPTTSGAQVQVLGKAETNDAIYFKPTFTIIRRN